MHCTPTEIAGWRLTCHAQARAAEHGFDDAELLAALERPEVSYTQTGHDKLRQVRQESRVAVVVDPVMTASCTLIESSAATLILSPSSPRQLTPSTSCCASWRSARKPSRTHGPAPTSLSCSTSSRYWPGNSRKYSTTPKTDLTPGSTRG